MEDKDVALKIADVNVSMWIEDQRIEA